MVPPPAEEKKQASVNPWRAYCMQYLKDHPECKTLKQAMIAAKSEGKYTKVPRKIKTGVKKENPWMTHINKWKSANPEWKDKYSYKDVLVLCKSTYKPIKTAA